MFGDLKNYINKRITLTKYEIVEFTSKMLAGSLYALLVALLLIFFTLLGSIALGFFLGNYFENYGYGFLVVTAIYLLFILILIIFRKSIKILLADMAVESAMSVLTNHEDEEYEEHAS